MQHQTKFDLDSYVDGECSDGQNDQLRSELNQNPELAAQVDQLDWINQQLRNSAAHTSAPDSLHDAVSQIIDGDAQSAPTSPNRRQLMIGGAAALAAGVTGVGVFTLYRQFEQNSGLVADTFFKDFETYLVKDRTLDVQETNVVKLAQWYDPRLPFTLPPVSSSGAGASLVGGRLCWLLERRLASLSFDSADGPIVLYISQSNDLDLPAGGKADSFGRDVTWHRSESSTSLIWTTDGLLMAMVGTQEISKLKRIARSIIG